MASTEPGTNNIPTSATTSTPPKLIASATVRLFKLSSTGAYEACEGGNPVGCVLMNSSATAFNILVYNGQRVTLATSTIVPQFRYNIRDLYFSFSDISSGSSWSVLFDQTEAMNTFVRAVATTIAFVCTHVGVDSSHSLKLVKLGLPTNKGAIDPTITLSTSGDTAGSETTSITTITYYLVYLFIYDHTRFNINFSTSLGVYYSAWRIGGVEEAGNLLEMYKRTPIREAPRSLDFEKIK